MVKKRVPFEELATEFSYNLYCQTGSDNKSDINRMKHFMSIAIENELTQRQKKCLCEYYFEGKTMTQIGKEMNINQSAVTRHIQRAIKNLKSRTIYYR